MLSMRTHPWRGRAAALLFGGTLMLHHLRYALAPGAADAGARPVHAYLGVLAPLAAAAVLLAGLLLARSLGSAPAAARRESATPSLRRLWLLAAAIMLAAYATQETVEWLGHAGASGGPLTLVGQGGWSALPLAAGLGLLVALLLRGAAAVVASFARRASVDRPRPERALAWTSAPWRRPSSAALALHLGSRAPPLPSTP
jgi:hypothetical protein